MRVYGGLHPLAAVPVHAVLVAYLALYPALFAGDHRPPAGTVRPGGAAARACGVGRGEYGRGTLLGGFPWVLLGSSQAGMLPIAQAASLVGVYGLSLVIAFVNTAAAYVLVGRIATRTSGGRRRCRRGAGGRVGRLGTDADRRRRPDAGRRAHSRRHRPGQRAAGPEVGSRPCGRHPAAGTSRARGTPPRPAPALSCGRSRPLRSSSRRTRPAARPSSGRSARPASTCSSAATRSSGGVPSPLLQRGVHADAGRTDRGRVPEDAPRAVRRVRAASSACCSSSGRSSKRCRTSRPAPSRRCCRSAIGGVSTAICYEIGLPVAHRALHAVGAANC